MMMRLSAMLLPVWVVFLFIAFALTQGKDNGNVSSPSLLAPARVEAPGEGTRPHHTTCLHAR